MIFFLKKKANIRASKNRFLLAFKKTKHSKLFFCLSLYHIKMVFFNIRKKKKKLTNILLNS
jgi:hypothetical protein